MVKKTLTLKESELAELITITATNIVREQDDMYYPDPNQPIITDRDSPAYHDKENKSFRDLEQKTVTSDVYQFTLYWYFRCNKVKKIFNNTTEAIDCTQSLMNKNSRDYYHRYKTQVALLWGELDKEVTYILSDWIGSMPYTSEDTKYQYKTINVGDDTLGIGVTKTVYEIVEKFGWKIWEPATGMAMGPLDQKPYAYGHWKIIYHICNKISTGTKLTPYEYKILGGEDYGLSGGRYKDKIIDCLEDNGAELSDSWFDYHIVLDLIAIILYIIGAIGTASSWTGVGAIIAAVALPLAMIIEFGNGLSYILVDDEPNYFLAGLTWCFMALPVFQLAKGPIKGITKTLSTAFKKGGLTLLTKTFKSLSKADKIIFKNFMEEFPGLKSAAKTGASAVTSAVKKIDAGIKAINGYWGTAWLVRQLQWIKSYILKPIKFGCTMLLQMAVILTAWDPASTGGVFRFLGTKFGADSFDSFADYLDQLSKDGIGGYSLFKMLLREYGSPKGVITTTKMNCNGEEYQWLAVANTYKNESPTEHYAEGDLEEAIWTAWKKGWRPGYGPYWDTQTMAQTHLNRKEIKDELALRILDEYTTILNHKSEVLEHEFGGKEEWANIVKDLECSRFIEEYEKENSDFELTLTIINDIKEDLGIK